MTAECPLWDVLQDSYHSAGRGDWASLVCLPSNRCSPMATLVPVSYGSAWCLLLSLGASLGATAWAVPGGWGAPAPTSHRSAGVLGCSTRRRLARSCLIPGGEEGCCLALERSPCPRRRDLSFLLFLRSLQFL